MAIVCFLGLSVYAQAIWLVLYGLDIEIHTDLDWPIIVFEAPLYRKFFFLAFVRVRRVCV